VVFSEDGTTEALYLDGVPIGTQTAHPDTRWSPNTYIGTGYLGASWPDEAYQGSSPGKLAYFNGTIARSRFWRSSVDDQTPSTLFKAAKNSAGIVPVETVQVTDPGSKTLTYRFDPQNSYRLISQTDGTAATTTYGYDTAGSWTPLPTATAMSPPPTTTFAEPGIETTCQVTASTPARRSTGRTIPMTPQGC